MPFHDMPQDQQSNLFNQAKEAWACIVPYWPLQSAVTLNPMEPYIQVHFSQIFSEDYSDAGAFFSCETREIWKNINEQTIKWLGLFFDKGQAGLGIVKKESLYQTLLYYWMHDPCIHNYQEIKRKKIRSFLCLGCPLLALDHCLRLYPSDDHLHLMQLSLKTLKGWAGYIKYFSQTTQPKHSIDIEYLALRLILIELFDLTLPKAPATVGKGSHENSVCHLGLFQAIQIQEQLYQNNLFAQIQAQDCGFNEDSSVVLQAVFCIDARSESLRRRLDAHKEYRTFGCAGFFALPIAVKNRFLSVRPYCPIICNPLHVLNIQGQESFLTKSFDLFKSAYFKMKYHPLASFFLADALGFLFFLWMFLKNFFPQTAYNLRQSVQTQVTDNFKEICDEIHKQIPQSDAVVYAYHFLKSIGMNKNFAPVVLLCGHHSVSDNNPHAHLLHCGACAGQHGSLNAKIMSIILNQENIKIALATQYNIFIPSETLFIPAQHNTVSQALSYEKIAGLSSSHLKILERLDWYLNSEQEKIYLEQSFLNQRKETHKKDMISSYSWSNTRPEWGLARNASFIIGPRDLTKKINLQARSFLHSYDRLKDCDGSLLASILSGPLVVAYFINMEYFFSTHHHSRFGSGTKILHNIISQIGVMKGNCSDLLVGLPLESVFMNESIAYHQPLRLSVVIDADLEMVQKILEKNLYLKTLVKNEWILVFYRDLQKHKIIPIQL